MSKLYLDEDPSTGMYDTSLNVLDLLAIQREIETELFKTAMCHDYTLHMFCFQLHMLHCI